MNYFGAFCCEFSDFSMEIKENVDEVGGGIRVSVRYMNQKFIYLHIKQIRVVQSTPKHIQSIFHVFLNIFVVFGGVLECS